MKLHAPQIAGLVDKRLLKHHLRFETGVIRFSDEVKTKGTPLFAEVNTASLISAASLSK
jgi:hypothetical protein